MYLKSQFNPQDPLKLESLLTDDEINLMLNIREILGKQLQPLVEEGFREQNQALNALQAIGKLKIFGGEIAHQYGGPQIGPVAYGLIARELERIDSGFRTLFSVMGSLVMKSIATFGTEEQQQKYLPGLNEGRLIGCFGLTEPDHGSDPSGMETIACKVAGGYEISGEKRWIGLAPYADIFIIWAKDEEGVVRGYIAEKNMPGLSVKMIEGKISLRTAPQGHITLDKVLVPVENVLVNAKGLEAPFTCLNYARYGIGWGALGAAEDCLAVALEYTQQRKQFGVPLASKQLIQKKLVEMQVEITLGLQSALQLGRLIQNNLASFLMINLIKYNSTKKALAIARDAREILGGNGILDEYRVMRHMVNLESVATYEGTSDIHILTLGRALTGFNAF